MGSTKLNNPLPNNLSSSSETSPSFPNPSPSTPSSSSTPTPPTTTATTAAAPIPPTTTCTIPTPPATTSTVPNPPATATTSTTATNNNCTGAGRRGSTITRVDVLRQRSRRAREQIRFLRDSHWTLLEHLRLRLREYYWVHGTSPILHNPSSSSPPPVPDRSNVKEEEPGGIIGGGGGVPLPVRVCAFPGCKLKPMELTSYCHQHILSDPNQTLYKPCSFVIKSGATGPVLCWKPVLRSMTPSLCSIHLQKAQKHVSHALKKAGLNLPSSNRTAPKFHVLIAEYVRQIQSKRKEAKKAASELAKSEGKKVS